MLNFEIFFNILADYSKASLKAEKYGEGKENATEPNLYIRFVKIGNPDFSMSMKASSLAATLPKYKTGTRCGKGSSYFPIIDNSYKIALRDRLEKEYDSIAKDIGELISIYWDKSYADKKQHVARMLQYCIEDLNPDNSDIDLGGKTRFFRMHKSDFTGNAEVPFEVLLIECWAYVVNHSDSPCANYQTEIDNADKYAFQMKIKLVPYPGYQFPRSDKKEIQKDEDEKAGMEDDFFEDEFFKDNGKKKVDISIGQVNIQGNNNNISAYTESQVINNYGDKKDE